MSINNIPVIGKILMLIGAFGIFSVGSTIFSTEKTKFIQSEYSSTISQEAESSVVIAQANNRFTSMRAGIAELELATTSVGNAAATKYLQESRTLFLSYLDKASKANPANAAAVDVVKQHALNLIDVTCGPAIKAGTESRDVASAAAATESYLKSCAPAFPAMNTEIFNLTEKSKGALDKKNNELIELTGGTVANVYAIVLSGLVFVVISGFLLSAPGYRGH